MRLALRLLGGLALLTVNPGCKFGGAAEPGLGQQVQESRGHPETGKVSGWSSAERRAEAPLEAGTGVQGSRVAQERGEHSQLATWTRSRDGMCAPPLVLQVDAGSVTGFSCGPYGGSAAENGVTG